MPLPSITSCTSSPLLGRCDRLLTNLFYAYSITVFLYLFIGLISRWLFLCLQCSTVSEYSENACYALISNM